MTGADQPDQTTDTGPEEIVVRLERVAGAGPASSDDGIRLLVLDRPSSLNAMNGALVRQLYERIEELRADDTARVVVLTGEGRGFCSGLDLEDAGGW